MFFSIRSPHDLDWETNIPEDKIKPITIPRRDIDTSLALTDKRWTWAHESHSLNFENIIHVEQFVFGKLFRVHKELIKLLRKLTIEVEIINFGSQIDKLEIFWVVPLKLKFRIRN